MFILMALIFFALIPSSALAVDTFLMEEVKQIMTCGENQRDVVRNSSDMLALQIARLDNGRWQIALGVGCDAAAAPAGGHSKRVLSRPDHGEGRVHVDHRVGR